MLRRSRHSQSNQAVANLDTSNLPRQIDAWVHTDRSPLGTIVLEKGWVEADELVDALKVERDEERRLGDVLLERNLINDHQLAEALAIQFGIPVADLRSETPEPEAVARVSEELARKHTAVPMRVDADRVYLAIPDPLDVAAIEELTQYCGRIGVFLGARSDILRVIDGAYNVLTAATQHIRAFELSDDIGMAESNAVELQVDETAPIVQVVNRILIQGVRARASDIHIEPREREVKVRFRIDGALTDAISLPQRMAPPISSRLKVMSDLNIVERRRPQDGQFSVVVDGRPVDVRISVVGTIHGEKLVMRLLDKTRSLISLDELGMPDAMVRPYLDIVTAPLGMLLCTGPTGSGKTTTLYATLAEVQDNTKNVVTIEDPVEYQFEGINQMPIHEAAGITFADGLRGILRQDPDVILVGEIRDAETARIATQAALTGHFVLSSLHSVDSVAALHRFTDMGVEPFLVASAISGVVGQRLMRRTCSACREEYSPPPDHVKLVKTHTGKRPERWTRGRGCNLCSGTGYSGRVGVYELLQVSDAIRDQIVGKATAKDIRETAIAEGMTTMLQEACDLVVEGVTTVDDVLRNVYAPGMDEESEIDKRPLVSIAPGSAAASGLDESDTGIEASA